MRGGLEGLQYLLKASSAKNDLLELATGRNLNHYKKKQIIYSEGNHPNRLFYVIQGKVKTFKTNEDGKELVIDLFSAGDFLGHIAILEGATYNDTAEAMEDTDLAIIPREDFDQLMNNSPEIARKFVQLLAKNISEKEEQLLHLAYNSLRKKVADALLTIQSKYQDKNEEQFVIDISRDNLATIAGTAKESLIRTLGDFKDEKIIGINEGRISILNRKKLQDIQN